MNNIWPIIAQQISAATNFPFQARTIESLSGGCINQTYRITDDRRRYFIKINHRRFLPMFEAEADGLMELARPAVLRIPAPICTGSAANYAFLVLEYLDFIPINNAGREKLGRGLALLHQTNQKQFGWFRDNAIGATPQENTFTDDWGRFWHERRLGVQLQLARHDSEIIRRGEKLLAALPIFFRDYHPRPSLVHGDLWNGNCAITQNGEPSIFDPAVYYGDRETDLAMSELFGGFGARFYAAYREVWPLDSGYQYRKPLYNLYHILNHFQLFGGGYAPQAIKIMDDLLQFHSAC